MMTLLAGEEGRAKRRARRKRKRSREGRMD
jgi:hypothetical protein